MSESIMENKDISKINNMGSVVVDGFECKPKILDPNKPIMHYKNIVHICVDKRCASKGSSKKADELRQIVKDMGLDVGENRIKISKSFCYGACRYKQVANIFSNEQANGQRKHNNVWLKNTDEYDISKWIDLFTALKENRYLNKFKQIKMKVY